MKSFANLEVTSNNSLQNFYGPTEIKTKNITEKKNRKTIKVKSKRYVHYDKRD